MNAFYVQLQIDRQTSRNIEKKEKKDIKLEISNYDITGLCRDNY